MTQLQPKKMKLHWSPRSPFVRKVMVVLHETGHVDNVELLRNVVAMTKPNPAVMLDNPLNKIPTLVLADGAVLFDSRVICEFFDQAVTDPKLFPEESHERFRALTWQALGDGLMELLLIWRNWHTERKLAPDDQEDAYLRAFSLKARSTLDTLEAQAPMLAEGRYSIGHIAIGCALSFLDFRWADLQWRTARPQLTAWHLEFSRRPAVIATAFVDDA